jgi:DNA-binding SARP family transcriptional activator
MRLPAARGDDSGHARFRKGIAMTTSPAPSSATVLAGTTRAVIQTLPPQPLRIQLLGAFGVEIGGRRVGTGEWRLRKACSLVKLLALAPHHRLSRKQAQDLLWPDLPPAAAANNLRGAIHVARRTLPGVGISAPGQALALPAATTDVAQFEAAAVAAHRQRDVTLAWQAVELYAGDLLPEDTYDDWLREPREALRAAYQTVLLLLAQLEQERGQPPGAIAALERLVAHDPLHEGAHQDLMRLYARFGRRGQALRQFERLREAMRRDLDLEPDAATRQLYLAIRGGEPGGSSIGAAADAGPDCYTVGGVGGV